MALKDTILQQGGDLAIEIPVLEDGNPFDLTTATDIIAAILVNNKTQSKYSLITKAGYGDATIKVGAGNEHILLLHAKRNETKTFPIGLMKISVLVDNPDTLLTEKRKEFVFDAGSVSEGFLKNEDI